MKGIRMTEWMKMNEGKFRMTDWMGMNEGNKDDWVNGYEWRELGWLIEWMKNPIKKDVCQHTLVKSFYMFRGKYN